MFDLQVTRLQFGQNNTRDTETFSDQPVEDRTKVHEYNNDFDEYNTGNYTVSSIGTPGAGNSTFTAVAGDGGIIQASTGATTNAGFSLQNIRADYLVELGKRMWVVFLFSVDNALANLIAGLLNTTANPTVAGNRTDGWTVQSAGTTALSIELAVAGAKTTIANAAVLNPGLGNYVAFKTYWDGGIYASAPAGRIVWELSGTGIVTPARGEIAAPSGFPTATLLNPTAAITPSTGVSRQMNLDLFSIIKERANILATPTF